MALNRLPRSANWIEEMEKRSRRRTRDLVTQLAVQGLSENEIGCARISMMARSKTAPFTGRIQKRKTNPLHHSHLACNTRPVHTVGSNATLAVTGWRGRYTPNSGHSIAVRQAPLRAMCGVYGPRPIATH
jgi:hypothetical protein